MPASLRGSAQHRDHSLSAATILNMPGRSQTAAAVDKARRLARTGKYRSIEALAAASGTSATTLRRNQVKLPKRAADSRTSSPTLRRNQMELPKRAADSSRRADASSRTARPAWASAYLRLISRNADAAHLDNLADTHDHETLAGVALHPNTAPDTLDYIAARETLRVVQHSLLLNPSLSGSAITRIAATLGDPPETSTEIEMFDLCASHRNAPQGLRPD